jgi:plastocyanin
MRSMFALGVATGIAAFTLFGLQPAEAVAAPDRTVAIYLGGLRESATTVNLGEQVTWINASGTPVARVVFDEVTGAPTDSGLFTSSVTRTFSRPGVYPYTTFLGARAPVRGRIVVE